jgi:hypothetical protein
MHGVGFAWGSGGRKCPQTSTLHGIVWEYTPCADQVTHELNTSQSVVRVVLALLTYKPELNVLRVFGPPKEHHREQSWKGRALWRTSSDETRRWDWIDWDLDMSWAFWTVQAHPSPVHWTSFLMERLILGFHHSVTFNSTTCDQTHIRRLRTEYVNTSSYCRKQSTSDEL